MRVEFALMHMHMGFINICDGPLPYAVISIYAVWTILLCSYFACQYIFVFISLHFSCVLVNIPIILYERLA